MNIRLLYKHILRGEVVYFLGYFYDVKKCLKSSQSSLPAAIALIGIQKVQS
jgi:hypothetical protein